MAVQVALQWFAALAALISAALWLVSALVKVKPIEKRDEAGLLPVIVTDTAAGADVLATLKAQARWNTRAAAAASIAAAAQALFMIL
jgi:hypothetical protein